MNKIIILLSVLFANLTIQVAQAQSVNSTATRIDVSRAPAPLFDDPLSHGASDPFVIWNPLKKMWFMYYTQRRASMPNPKGTEWVHGSAIGIATSKDGLKWKYAGTCKGDHKLSNPLLGEGSGPMKGVTWWAPAYIYDGKKLHMFVTLVNGVYNT